MTRPRSSVAAHDHHRLRLRVPRRDTPCGPCTGSRRSGRSRAVEGAVTQGVEVRPPFEVAHRGAQGLDGHAPLQGRLPGCTSAISPHDTRLIFPRRASAAELTGTRENCLDLRKAVPVAGHGFGRSVEDRRGSVIQRIGRALMITSQPMPLGSPLRDAYSVFLFGHKLVCLPTGAVVAKTGPGSLNATVTTYKGIKIRNINASEPDKMRFVPLGSLFRTPGGRFDAGIRHRRSRRHGDVERFRTAAVGGPGRDEELSGDACATAGVTPRPSLPITTIPVGTSLGVDVPPLRGRSCSRECLRRQPPPATAPAGR